MAQEKLGRIAPLLQEAQATLVSGRAAAAERQCRKALRQSPGNPSALLLLGLCLLQQGQAAAALMALKQAAAGTPDAAEAHFSLAAAAQATGDTLLAEASYAAVIALQPPHAQALNNLAGLLLSRGMADAAEPLARRATQAAPSLGAAHNTLGNAQAALGRTAEAADSYRRAIARNPDLAPAHDNLGQMLQAEGRMPDAVAQFRRAIAADPRYAWAHWHLGIALRQAQAADDAVAALRTAAHLLPHDATIATELAGALLDAQRAKDAEIAYRAALVLDPANVRALCGLGNALAWQHKFEEARASYRLARDAGPQSPAPLFYDGIVALLQGDYAGGLPLYEHRAGEAALDGERDAFPQPRWDGSDPAGRTILLHDEQGFGDTLMFARYAPMLAARGARVILQVRPPLCPLLESLPGIERTIPRGEPVAPATPRCPLPSLPLLFGTTAATIPGSVPYLAAPAGRIGHWRARLGEGSPLIGLAWAGNPTPPHRSIPLALLRGLLQTNALRFVVLQREISAPDAAVLAGFANVVVPGDALGDFADTAAIMELCDLVLSVDTAAGHLAGALARPVWIGLPYLPDWRWGVSGDSTPWYPTARLDRQASPGNWGSVTEAWQARLRTPPGLRDSYGATPA